MVEDDTVTQLLLKSAMVKRGHTVTCLTNAEDALVLLEGKWFQLVVLDIGLPGMNGLELCQRMRKLPNGEHYYIIVGTGVKGAKELTNILEAGADDYIAKPYIPSLLDVRIAVAEKRVQEIEDRDRMQRELVFLAKHDPLTRLLNRWQLDAAIEEAVQNSEITGAQGSLLIIDLDHFKEVNDTCGHQAGDRLLVHVAESLQNTLPKEAIIVRYGGDEFVAVLPNTPTSSAIELTDLLAEAINGLDLPDVPDMIRPSASMGMTSINKGYDALDLLKEADTACYRAKSLGKNRAEVFVRFNEKLLIPRKKSRSPSAHPAEIDDDELELWFQPICNLQTGEILFQEALLRFVSSRSKNPVQAGMFMSQMNDRAYIRSLDRFVVQEICNCFNEYPNLTASINIHAHSVTDMNFADTLIDLLQENKIPGSRLFLEITETQSITDLPLAESVIGRIRKTGVQFALDDLGAGFASLVTLKTLPISLVKIDGSLIRNLPEESFSQTFLHALGVFSVGIGFQTVAERLEKLDEMVSARNFGIHYGQGYLIGRPRRLPYTQAEIDPSLYPNPLYPFIH